MFLGCHYFYVTAATVMALKFYEFMVKVDFGNTKRVLKDITNVIRLMQFATFVLVHKKEPFFCLGKHYIKVSYVQ